MGYADAPRSGISPHFSIFAMLDAHSHRDRILAPRGVARHHRTGTNNITSFACHRYHLHWHSRHIESAAGTHELPSAHTEGVIVWESREAATVAQDASGADELLMMTSFTPELLNPRIEVSQCRCFEAHRHLMRLYPSDRMSLLI